MCLVLELWPVTVKIRKCNIQREALAMTIKVRAVNHNKDHNGYWKNDEQNRMVNAVASLY